MGNGTYEELLPCSGKLKVTPDAWHVEYYFSGPDLRYSGTLFSVEGKDIPGQINALEDNWREYKALLAAIPKGGEFTRKGKGPMTIRVGGWAEGVCFGDYHRPMATEADVQGVIAGYRYALEKAERVMRVLRTL